MKELFKALDGPLYITIALLVNSLIFKTNFIAEEPLAYAISMVVAWGVSYLIRHFYKGKKVDQKENPDGD